LENFFRDHFNERLKFAQQISSVGTWSG